MQGKTRANQVSALLSNWTIAEKSLQSALNSTGVAVNENKIYLDSIQGRLATLKATAQGFANDIIDPNWIKQIITAGDYLVRFIDIIATADDKAFKWLIEKISELTAGLEKLQGVFLLPEISSRFKMLEKYVDIFGKIPSLITAIVTAMSVARKQTSFLPTNLLGNKKIEEEYDKTLVGNVKRSVFDDFNTNVLGNETSTELQRLIKLADKSSDSFGQAKDSLEDYLSARAFNGEKASLEDYNKFVQEKAQEKYSGLYGFKRYMRDYKALQQTQEGSVDTTPTIDVQSMQEQFQEVAESSQEFFEEMVSRGVENGTEQQSNGRYSFRRRDRISRAERRAQEREQNQIRNEVSNAEGSDGGTINFSEINITQEQIDRAEDQINERLPEFVLTFRTQVDDQEVEDSVDEAESSNLIDDIIENGVDSVFEDSSDNVEETREQLEEIQEATENVTTSTENAENAQRGLAAALSSLYPNFARFQQEHPDGTMRQYAGQLIKTKAAQFGAQAAQTALNAVLSFGVSTIITGLVSQLSQAVNYYKDLAEAGKELSDQFEKGTEELSDFVDKFREYKDELNSGNLTESEAYDTRTKLLDIQRQMIDTYGEEVNGIDLVNGSLESQVKLMERLGSKKASDFLAENAQAINQAEKALEKPRWFAPTSTVKDYQTNWLANDYSIYQGNIGKASEAAAAEVERIIKKAGLQYSNGYISAVGMTDTETIEAWTTLSTELRKSTLIDNDKIQQLLNQISEEIKDLNDDTYQNNQTIKQQASIARIMDNDTYLTTYDDVTKEIENYRDAVARGDQEFAAQSLDTLRNFEDTISNDSAMDKWVQEYLLGLFDGVDQQMRESEYRKQLSEDNSESKVAAQGVIDQYFSGMDDQTIKSAQAGTEEYIALMELVDNSPVDSIEELVNAWIKLGMVETRVVDETAQAVKSFKQQTEELSQPMSNINAVDSAMKTLMTGGEIDFSTLSSLLEAYPELIDDIEETQQGYKVSAKALQKMRNAQLADIRSNITDNIYEARKEIQKLNEENEDLNKRISKNNLLSESMSEFKETISEADDQIVNLRYSMTVSESTGINELLQKRQEISNQLREVSQRIANGEANYYNRYTDQYSYLVQEYDQLTNAIVKVRRENDGAFDAIERRVGTIDYQSMSNQLDANIKYYELAVSVQEDQGFVLDENNELVTKQGETYQDLIDQNKSYEKQIKENTKQIEHQNRYTKQQKFLWRAQASGLPDYVEQIKNLMQSGTNESDLLQKMKDEQEQYGTIAADTAAEFMESMPNWSEYITVDKNGIIKMVDGVYDEILDEATGYTDKMEALNIAEAGITAGKDMYGDVALKSLINQYQRNGIDIEYEDEKDYLTNLSNLKTALEEQGRLDKNIAATLKTLEEDYNQAIEGLGESDKEKTIMTIANTAVALHNNITGFESKITEWKKQLDNDEISENDYATYYNNYLDSIKDVEGYSSDDQKKIEDYIATNYQQIKDMQQRNYDDEKTLLDNQLEDRLISHISYQKQLAEIDEKYYGAGSTLGKSDEGKKQHEANLREIKKLAKDAYDDLVARLDSAVDYGTIIDPNLISDIQEAFGGEIPAAIQQALQKALSEGTLNEADILPIVQGLGTALLSGADLNDAIVDYKSKVISAYEYEVQQLEQDFEDGLISSSELIDGLTERWRKYYKDKQEFAEEDKAAQRSILEAQKNQIQEQIDALEAYSEKLTTPYQNEIDALNEVKDKYGEVMDKKIDALQKQKDALDKANEEQERENDLLEKKKALEKASIKNRIVLTSNGWQARRDEEAYNEAKKEYDKAKQTEQSDLIEKQIKALQEEKESREKVIDDEIKSRQEIIDNLKSPIENLTKAIALTVADQHNLDPQFLMDVLTAESGQAAVDAVNEMLGFSQQQEAQYGVDVPNDLLTVDDARDIANDAAKNNKTADEYAAGLGLSLGEAVTDANQKAIDELLAKYNKLVANRKTKGSDYEFEGHTGKVDYNNRPINLNEDDYNTLLGTTVSYAEVAEMFDEYLKSNNIDSKELWEICEALWAIVDTNENMHFNVSPLRPDGTAITNLNGNDDQFFGGIYDYILSQLASGIRLEDMDIFMGGNYASGDEADRAAQEAHNDSARIYDLEADILRRLIALGYDVNKLDGVKYTGEIPVQANNNNKNSATSNTQHAANNTDLNTNTTSTDKNTEALNDLTTAITGIDNNTAEADTVTAGGFNLVADPETGKLTKKPIMVGDKQIEGQKIRAVTKSEWEKKHDKNEWSPNNKNIVPLDSLDMSFITDSKLLGFVNAARNWTSNIRQGMINVPRAADIAATSLVQPTATVGAPVFNCNITVEGNADKKTVQAFKTELHNELCEYTDQLYNSLHNSFIRQKNKK